MFNRKFKLFVTAIGLVTVLVMGLAMPGVTQQNPLTRQDLVQAINRVVAPTLTAGEGIVFNVDRAVLYSDDEVTFVYIPLDTTSQCWQLNCWASSLLDEKVGGAVIGMFVVPDFHPDVKFPLPRGTYIIRAASPDRAVFVNQEGDEVASVQLKVTRLETRITQPIVEIATKHSSPWEVHITIKCCGASVDIIIIST